MPPSKRSKGGDSTAALRTITSLLTSDSTLPAHIPKIASLLYSSSVLESCHSLASASGTNAQKRKSASSGEDAGVLLHKYKTKISSLLQSKTPQARWGGTALVKVSVESSFECLASHGGVWVRLLVPLLLRPEPPATHRLIIATLARVFTVLTSDKPTLIREIVVPNLPATIGHLLSFCTTSDTTSISEVEILAHVLEALRDILQSHPVTFRPFAQKTHTLILSVLSSSPSPNEERLAREIFVLLHLCASGSSRGNAITNPDSSSSSSGNKATAVADEWARGFKAVIQDTHSTLNVIFRCVLEDNDYSRSGSFGGAVNSRETTLEATGSSSLGLPDWKGIMEGVERVTVLLRLLQSFFTLPSTAQVSIPIGQLVDLTTRIFSVAPSNIQINAAVERGERELMLARLPELQRGTLNLLSAVLARLGGLFAPFAFMVIEQLAYIFNDQNWDSEIKTAVYILLNTLLENFGTGLAKNIVQSIHLILMTSCDDLLPPPPPVPMTNNLPVRGSGKQKNGNANAAGNQNFHADSFLSVLPTGKFLYPGLVAAAEMLLATALAKLPTAYIRSELRTKMDRTAILTGNTEAMLASVLFPPAGARRGGAILPHLVGASNSKGLVIEGIVRPRLPIVWTGGRRGEGGDDEMEDVEEDEGESEGSEDDEDQEERSDEPSSSKNSYTEEALTGESPYKRQKMELSSAPEETKARKGSLLDDLIARAIESDSGFANQTAASEVSVRATEPTPEPSVTVASSSFISTTALSGIFSERSTEVKQKGTTSVVVENPRTLAGGDSDDDMEIPEIVMGGSSSEDEDGGEDEDEG